MTSFIKRAYIDLKLLAFSVTLLVISGCANVAVETLQSEIPPKVFQQQSYLHHQVIDDTLVITTTIGQVKLTALAGDAIEVFYLESNVEQLPSFSKNNSLVHQIPEIEITEQSIKFSNGDLLALVNKNNLTIRFYRDKELLTEQMAYFRSDNKRGFDFKLTEHEKILGGGQRVLGMNRRGHRMPLYNRAHYGYGLTSNQMNFSLPMIMSNKKYSILFDNTAKGNLDIGKTTKDTLSFEAVSGRTAYIVFSGNSYPNLIKHYVEVTGKQPMPPRWALGHFLSRFGYRTENEVRNIVQRTIEEGFPVDAIILDLYWFGPDITGHMGNLAWDKTAFPTHQDMLDDLIELGVMPILVTEPFILTNSLKWSDAVENKALITNDQGEPYRYDFYFGNTGLIDVFDESSRQWFWDIYADLFNQGVAGTWGDLGEPEVHPDDSLHYVSEIDRNVRADAVHNAYGHQWAKLVYENQIKLQPNKRPFIMMRSGFAGSQRYGMIPWTGDVDRSWLGLKPQVELSLQMGLLGMAYTHSDLGGFAGAKVFDSEMYIRWLQYGVFQPIYRPHAQDHIASEVVLHDQQTKDILREYIKLRYQLLPYNYTLAYQNSTTGMPLMRPVFFEDEDNVELIDIKDSYLWGDSFFVSPITNAGITSKSINLPKGRWFNFWTDQIYEGNQSIEVDVDLTTIPVFVRAGSLIPMVADLMSTKDYSSENLILHYYADESVVDSKGEMFEDNGIAFDSIAKNEFELLKFEAKHHNNTLTIVLSRTTESYANMSKNRAIKVVIHQWLKKPDEISFAGKSREFKYDKAKQQLTVNIEWDHQQSELFVR